MIKMNAKLYLPFPFKVPKGIKDLSSNILWLQNIGLIKRYEHAELVARTSSEYLRCCYPNIANCAFHDFVDFASWNCLMDDIMEESNGVFKSSEDKVELLCTFKFICEHDLERTEEVEEKFALINAFIDVKSRIKKHISDENYYYIMYSLSHFFSGIIWEISSNYTKKRITLDYYCMIKTKSVGVLMAYSLSLALHNIKPDAKLMNEKTFVIMMNCILFVMAIDNDIYSFNKEKNGKEKIFNIIDIIQHTMHVDLHQATALSISIRNKYLHKYILLKGELSSHPNIKNYAACFESLIAGNIYFGSSCQRYTNKIETHNGSNSGTFTSSLYSFEISPDYYEDNIQSIIDLTPSTSWWLNY
ncbi:terpene synthase family protein [Serratia fonticola]|uniref:terpene synthase family protein n=1 Tax=Serratia fonticola TaxID=47917 RepID=UPI003B00C73B